jgi:hypothetical protein
MSLGIFLGVQAVRAAIAGARRRQSAPDTLVVTPEECQSIPSQRQGLEPEAVRETRQIPSDYFPFTRGLGAAT